MGIRNSRNLAVLSLFGLILSGSHFGSRPARAGDWVRASDDLCEDCDNGCCGCGCCANLCSKLTLHKIYFKRCCSQKYVLLPSSPAIAPYACPAPATPYGSTLYSPAPRFGAPTYGAPYANPYGNPNGNYGIGAAPPPGGGVFIR